MNTVPEHCLIARVQLHSGGRHFFTVEPDLALSIGQPCITAFQRHTEWGQLQELSQGHASADDAASGPNRMGKVLRAASPDDREQHRQNLVLETEALQRFAERIRYLHLPMRPLRAIYSFGRERAELLYGAEQPLDPRRLTHDMQCELGLHVEIRHLGVRDAAAILDGYGTCGRQLCCASWLQRFRSVNMRMAKVQDLSLNPGSVNGMCGRLKCCLRYEYEQYRDAAVDLPEPGTHVRWEQGHGVVLGRQTLCRRLIVRRSDHVIQRIDAADIIESEPAAGPGRAMEPHPTGEPHDESPDDPDRERTEPVPPGDT